MLKNQLLVELRRTCTIKNQSIWLFIIIFIPILSFFPLRDGYIFYQPVELFQSMISTFIPLLFPVLVIIIYLPNFLQELNNNFILYTRPRISLRIYILSKGLINMFLTGLIIFLMIFLPFVFAMYIEPNLSIINYSTSNLNQSSSEVTFSQLLTLGEFTYGFLYSIWVSVNAIVYSTIAYLLMLNIRSSFIGLSVPFLFYHIFNFVTGVGGLPKFSPISTIFPFNIEQQPIWTALIPFSFLLISLVVLFLITIHNQKEWVI